MDNEQRTSVLLSIIELATMLVYQDTEHGLGNDYVNAIREMKCFSIDALEAINDSRSKESDESEFTSGDGLSPETFKTIEV